VDVDLIEPLTLKIINISCLGVYTEYKEVENIFLIADSKKNAA
jgi:hypothetical protein